MSSARIRRRRWLSFETVEARSLLTVVPLNVAGFDIAQLSTLLSDYRDAQIENHAEASYYVAEAETFVAETSIAQESVSSAITAARGARTDLVTSSATNSVNDQTISTGSSTVQESPRYGVSILAPEIQLNQTALDIFQATLAPAEGAPASELLELIDIGAIDDAGDAGIGSDADTISSSNNSVSFQLDTTNSLQGASGGNFVSEANNVPLFDEHGRPWYDPNSGDPPPDYYNGLGSLPNSIAYPELDSIARDMEELLGVRERELTPGLQNVAQPNPTIETPAFLDQPASSELEIRTPEPVVSEIQPVTPALSQPEVGTQISFGSSPLVLQDSFEPVVQVVPETTLQIEPTLSQTPITTPSLGQPTELQAPLSTDNNVPPQISDSLQRTTPPTVEQSPFGESIVQQPAIDLQPVIDVQIDLPSDTSPQINLPAFDQPTAAAESNSEWFPFEGSSDGPALPPVESIFDLSVAPEIETGELEIGETVISTPRFESDQVFLQFSQFEASLFDMPLPQEFSLTPEFVIEPSSDPFTVAELTIQEPAVVADAIEHLIAEPITLSQTVQEQTIFEQSVVNPTVLQEEVGVHSNTQFSSLEEFSIAESTHSWQFAPDDAEFTIASVVENDSPVFTVRLDDSFVQDSVQENVDRFFRDAEQTTESLFGLGSNNFDLDLGSDELLHEGHSELSQENREARIPVEEVTETENSFAAELVDIGSIQADSDQADVLVAYATSVTKSKQGAAETSEQVASVGFEVHGIYGSIRQFEIGAYEILKTRQAESGRVTPVSATDEVPQHLDDREDLTWLQRARQRVHDDALEQSLAMMQNVELPVLAKLPKGELPVERVEVEETQLEAADSESPGMAARVDITSWRDSLFAAVIGIGLYVSQDLSDRQTAKKARERRPKLRRSVK